jgi:hypothetical protein
VPLGDDAYGQLNCDLLLHEDVLAGVDDLAALRKRVGIVLQHLAAHGRTSVVKGCADAENRGWRRSPLGGNGGMQYYLWWRPLDSTMGRRESQRDGTIVVRAVRHHDDHAPLTVGDLTSGDYILLAQPEFEDGGIVGSPWTAEQLDFVNADDPV